MSVQLESFIRECFVRGIPRGTVFLIAGTVFAHYAVDLRREERAMPLPVGRPGRLARIAVSLESR